MEFELDDVEEEKYSNSRKSTSKIIQETPKKSSLRTK
jgi:hypothetical protein